MTNEQKVLDVIKERSFFVTLGGEQVEMSPLTLSIFDEMGALSSILPVLDNQKDDGVNIASIFSLSGSGSTMAKILFLSATTIENSLIRRWYETEKLFKIRKQKNVKREQKALFELIYHKTTFLELRLALLVILERSQVFFYHDCITTLNGANRLKPTKETEATAPGLSK